MYYIKSDIHLNSLGCDRFAVMCLLHVKQEHLHHRFTSITASADWHVLAICSLSVFFNVSASCIWPRGSSGLWVRFLCCLCTICWGMILNSSLWQLISSWRAWDPPNSRRRRGEGRELLISKAFPLFLFLFSSLAVSPLLSQSLQSTSWHSLATSCCCKQSRRPSECMTLPKSFYCFYCFYFFACKI